MQIRNDTIPSSAAAGWKNTAKQLVTGFILGTLLLASLAGRACGPGYIGPYGGVHPGRCVVL